MSLELSLVIIFSAIMAVWNGYLMRQNHVLVNKLMSRNYGEYETAKAFGENAKDENIQSEVEELDPFDQQKAREVNHMFGMG